jgi:hypothetical protein
MSEIVRNRWDIWLNENFKKRINEFAYSLFDFCRRRGLPIPQ